MCNNDSFLVVRIDKSETDLGYDIFIPSSGVYKDCKDIAPFLTVAQQDEMIKVTISDNPKAEIELQNFDKIVNFIALHKPTLLAHWQGSITDRELLDTICKKIYN